MSPVQEEARKGPEKIGENVIAPALNELGKNQLGPALENIGKVAGNASVAAGTWISEHPAEIGLVVTGGVVSLAPCHISGLVLGALGWTSSGAGLVSLSADPQDFHMRILMTKIGTVASGIQAAIGNVVAESQFAILQSAATGGYGAAIVGAAVRNGGLITGAAGALIAIVKAVPRWGRRV